MRECIHCKYSKGLGSDVWCGHNPRGKESYMMETDCPYFKLMRFGDDGNDGDDGDDYGRNNVLTICKKLQRLKLIKDIEEHKYSIEILINYDEEFEKDSYEVRDRIKNNFEKQGYKVHIKGTYWLDIMFADITQQIDDCFNNGD